MSIPLFLRRKASRFFQSIKCKKSPLGSFSNKNIRLDELVESSPLMNNLNFPIDPKTNLQDHRYRPGAGQVCFNFIKTSAFIMNPKVSVFLAILYQYLKIWKGLKGLVELLNKLFRIELSFGVKVRTWRRSLATEQGCRWNQK